MARERVTKAAAVQQLAAAQLLPSINFGVNFNNHIGPLQAASGQIVQSAKVLPFSPNLIVGYSAGTLASAAI